MVYLIMTDGVTADLDALRRQINEKVEKTPVEKKVVFTEYKPKGEGVFQKKWREFTGLLHKGKPAVKTTSETKPSETFTAIASSVVQNKPEEKKSETMPPLIPKDLPAHFTDKYGLSDTTETKADFGVSMEQKGNRAHPSKAQMDSPIANLVLDKNRADADLNILRQNLDWMNPADGVGGGGSGVDNAQKVDENKRLKADIQQREFAQAQKLESERLRTMPDAPLMEKAGSTNQA